MKSISYIQILGASGHEEGGEEVFGVTMESFIKYLEQVEVLWNACGEASTNTNLQPMSTKEVSLWKLLYNKVQNMCTFLEEPRHLS
jgi:hypothetical protein